MQDTLVVVNRTAGKGKCEKLWPLIETELTNLGVGFDTCFTVAKGDGARLAKQGAESGYRCIISVGGDGTLSEVVNGLADFEQMIIGAIPAGSGNDFIRSIGLKPDDWQSACSLIKRGNTKPIDLGRVNGRYFINVSGVGFDASVANCANEWGKKHFKGSFAYIAALLKVLGEFRPSETEIKLDGQVIRGKSWLVAVGNAQYFGGGMRVTPKADPSDGLLDVCILGDLSKVGFLKAFPSVFSGQHLKHPAIHYYQAKKVEVKTVEPFLVQADGEIIGATPITFQVRVSALSLLS